MYVNKYNVSSITPQTYNKKSYYDKFSIILALNAYKLIENSYGSKVRDIQVWGIGIDNHFDPHPCKAYFKIIYQFVILPKSPQAIEVMLHLETSKIRPFDKRFIAIDNGVLVKKALKMISSKLKSLEPMFF